MSRQISYSSWDARSERELHALVTSHRPRLLAETGRGALTAALLIGRTAGAHDSQATPASPA